jgi:putative thioredoxin
MTLLSDNTADAPASSSGAGGYIVQATAQNFMREVMEASLQMPVLVYFTAAWCGPCKQFGPLLEKVVNEAKGRLRLARVDVDANPQLAQQFRIQSVPMLYIFVNGQPVDGVAGAMQESQIKQLVSQFMSATPAEEDARAMLEKAKELLAAGDAEQASRLYQAVAALDGESVEAVAGLASAHVALGNTEEAEALLRGVPENAANNEHVVSANARLALAKSAPKQQDVRQLRDILAKEPGAHETRYALANALFANGDAEEAINELLHIIAGDKDWNEGAARKQLLVIFEALGFENPLAFQGRRKLSAILFK